VEALGEEAKAMMKTLAGDDKQKTTATPATTSSKKPGDLNTW
jgi:hypothetical protein